MARLRFTARSDPSASWATLRSSSIMTAPTSGPIAIFSVSQGRFEPEAVCRCSARRFQRHRPALGQPALRLGRDEGARLRVVDPAPALGRSDLRLHPPRSLPRLRAVLEIPAGEPTAINGRWVDGPKDELFDKLREHSAGCRSSPKIWDTSRPKCTLCASAIRFRECAVLQFGFGDAGPMSTCRIV